MDTISSLKLKFSRKTLLMVVLIILSNLLLIISTNHVYAAKNPIAHPNMTLQVYATDHVSRESVLINFGHTEDYAGQGLCQSFTPNQWSPPAKFPPDLTEISSIFLYIKVDNCRGTRGVRIAQVFLNASSFTGTACSFNFINNMFAGCISPPRHVSPIIGIS